MVEMEFYTVKFQYFKADVLQNTSIHSHHLRVTYGLYINTRQYDWCDIFLFVELWEINIGTHYYIQDKIYIKCTDSISDAWGLFY